MNKIIVTAIAASLGFSGVRPGGRGSCAGNRAKARAGLVDAIGHCHCIAGSQAGEQGPACRSRGHPRDVDDSIPVALDDGIPSFWPRY